MIARLEHRDGGTDAVDDADAFMAQDAAGLAGWEVAFEDVQIGAANRRLCYLTIASVGAAISGFGRSSRAFLPTA